MKTVLDLDDIAQVVADTLKKQRKELVEHLDRRVVLAEMRAKAADSDESVRAGNLHRRVTVLESQVRTLMRNRESS